MKFFKNFKTIFLRSSFLRLIAYVKPYMSRLFVAFVAVFITSILSIIPPWLLKYVVDDVLIKKQKHILFLLSLSIVVIYVLKGITYYFQHYLMSWVGQKVVFDLRNTLYDCLHKMSLSFFVKRRIGDIISRLTNDVNMIQDLVANVVIDMVMHFISLVGVLGFLLYINWRLTIVTFCVLPIAIFSVNRATKKLRVIGRDIQDRISDLNAVVQEVVNAIRVVRSFATEDIEKDRFRKVTEENFNAVIKGAKTKAALTSVVEVILTSSLALLLWFGGSEVIKGRLTPGELVAFLGYLMMVVQPISALSRLLGNVQQGLAAADRVFEILDVKPDVVEDASPLKPVSLKGEVVFKDVWFAYHGREWVLKDINLHVKPGEKIAIVGPTGAGKSTLADLILRFYDPQRGVIMVDGVDIKRYSIVSYRRQIGFVPQDTMLLRGTIAYNISYGLSDVSMDDIVRAAKIAGIHDFIVSLPKGYYTEVTEKGINLSGGQRQRIAIARAIIRNPKILIMDEATSALDAEVESKLQETLKKVLEGKTAFIIAHRLSTVRLCDRIIVLDNGKIVEEGTHYQLMEKKGLYSKLYTLQLGGKKDVWLGESEDVAFGG